MKRVVQLAQQLYLGLTSRSAAHYWERRYRTGWTSGSGSAGALATYKADVLNQFVVDHAIASVAEFGCGDGSQLQLARYPRYVGFDVARRAIEICSVKFRADATKSFLWYDPTAAQNLAALFQVDLTLSLDVVYHLLEDAAYEAHLRDVFSTSRRFAIIYSSDKEDSVLAPHVKHRAFVRDVSRDYPQFHLVERLENPHAGESFANFHIFERREINGPR